MSLNSELHDQGLSREALEQWRYNARHYGWGRSMTARELECLCELALEALTGSEGSAAETERKLLDHLARVTGDAARLRAENERLREEVATWKDRYEAERTDHEAALRDLAAVSDCQRT